VPLSFPAGSAHLTAEFDSGPLAGKLTAKTTVTIGKLKPDDTKEE
jgi:hypothetical protein